MISTNAKYLLTDSRQLVFPSETLFFAIKGERHDGHRYIVDLYQKGVLQFVVETPALTPTLRQTIDELSEAVFFEVENSITALQVVAQKHRSQFDLPVIGVTGSNGKTIVKEWLAQTLGVDFNIVKSPKSYNSQIGVPLSVWQINASHTLGIFEAGVSRPHEMKALEGIIRPNIGIFTNIGTAHDEGFKTPKQKIAEKLQLFAHCQKLIYNANYASVDAEINIIVRAINPTCEFIKWGREATNKWHVSIDKPSGPNTMVCVSTDQPLNSLGAVQAQDRDKRTQFFFESPFTDNASLENLTHCIISMLELGVAPTDIQRRISQLRPVSMRLEIKEGINNCYLIDDTYNNDLVGLTMALNFLGQQEQQPHKSVIVSDVLQTGQDEAELYQQIAQLLTEKKIQNLIGIGGTFVRNQSLFDHNSTFFASTEDFLRDFPLQSLHHSVVLVKGARPFQFERIVHRLQQKNHATVLEINLDALTHNLNFYRNRAGRDTKIMAMVKAFAYGGGSAEIAQLLQFHRVDYLAVAYADEGIALRHAGIELPIMVMNASDNDLDAMLSYRLEPEVYSPRTFAAALQKKHQILHLKIDTGMHRLGFTPEQLPDLLDQLRQNSHLRIASIFSHLVGADEAKHNDFSELQYSRFVEATQRIEATLGYRPLRHLLNSAGIVRFSDYKFDMVRLGIGLYGVEVNGYEQQALQNVGTLKSVISQIKQLEAGETVGYSRKGKIDHAQTIATIAIGYADGYDRRFSNGVGQVWVNGTLCPVVGNVCMDMTMIDISAAQAQEGDEVIVFGKELPVSTLAHRIGTIPYEIMTGISERVKRVFFKESN